MRFSQNVLQSDSQQKVNQPLEPHSYHIFDSSSEFLKKNTKLMSEEEIDETRTTDQSQNLKEELDESLKENQRLKELVSKLESQNKALKQSQGFKKNQIQKEKSTQRSFLLGKKASKISLSRVLSKCPIRRMQNPKEKDRNNYELLEEIKSLKKEGETLKQTALILIQTKE